MSRSLIAVSLATLCLSGPAWGQNYPTRPVRVIVGFGTGGPDTTARIISPQLTVQMGQPFIVDNRPGAAGIIGTDVVAKAAPDGYTLLVATNSFAINPSIYKKLPYDVNRDFTPISHLSSSEAAFLVVHPALPVQNLKELIAYARKPENRVSYGSPGIGSGLHLRNALFSAKTGANMVHVPYKGAGPAIAALMAGEVQVMFVTVTAALPLIKSGKLRALAYDYSTRADFMPDVPTMSEAGAPATSLGSGWHALLGPAKMPAPLIARLESEVRKAVAAPEVQQQFKKLALIPVGSTATEFRALLTSTLKTMSEAVRAAGIQAE